MMKLEKIMDMNTTTVSNQDNGNEVNLPLENEGRQIQAEPEVTQTIEAQDPPKRKRKSKAELLAVKLAKRAELDIKIVSLQKELDETTQKIRNRGLVLIGIVVEQCIKKKIFEANPPPTVDMTWWQNQAIQLPDKDKEPYKKFLELISKND